MHTQAHFRGTLHCTQEAELRALKAFPPDADIEWDALAGGADSKQDQQSVSLAPSGSNGRHRRVRAGSVAALVLALTFHTDVGM